MYYIECSIKPQRKRLCDIIGHRDGENKEGFGRWSCVVAAAPWLVVDERWSLQRNEPSCFVGAQTQVFPNRLLLLSRPSESVDHDFLMDVPFLFLSSSSSTFTRLDGLSILNLLVLGFTSSAMNQIVKLRKTKTHQIFTCRQRECLYKQMKITKTWPLPSFYIILWPKSSWTRSECCLQGQFMRL